MDATRTAACASISLTGVGLLLPGASYALGPDVTVVGLAIAGFGSAVAAALVLGGAWAYRSSLGRSSAVRVAGWNVLGLLVVGAVLALVSLHEPVSLPPIAAVCVLGASAVAHVLIGVNDVGRIRAEALASEREKTTVLNRLLRHNLRNDAQVLVGAADQLAKGDGVDHDLAATIRERGAHLGSMAEKAERLQAVVERDRDVTIDAAAVVRDVADRASDAFPAATVVADAPDALPVFGDDHLEMAVFELVENALEHGRDDARVGITARATGDGRVELRVADDGPGIPDTERAIVTGDREPTSTEHGSGLGLWLAKWIVESHGGDVAITDDAVTLHLDAA
jgi:signal transduction histidine kinase